VLLRDSLYPKRTRLLLPGGHRLRVPLGAPLEVVVEADPQRVVPPEVTFHPSTVLNSSANPMRSSWATAAAADMNITQAAKQIVFPFMTFTPSMDSMGYRYVTSPAPGRP
jgi:hypothetical protein